MNNTEGGLIVLAHENEVGFFLQKKNPQHESMGLVDNSSNLEG